MLSTGITLTDTDTGLSPSASCMPRVSSLAAASWAALQGRAGTREEVLVRLKAVALNQLDLKYFNGLNT